MRAGRTLLGLLGLAAVLGSCAYYNIFWMASQDYDKATAGKDLAEFWDPYGQKPLTGDPAKNIDSCAKRCGKILLLYPKSKWVDDALVLMGNCFVLKGEYANAIRKYEELLKFYPSSELADEAKYMRAYTHVLDGSADEALISLEAMREEIRARRWKEHVVFLTGRICQKNGDCAGAIGAYQAYLESFPDGRKIVDATLALADCLIKVGRQGEAAAILEPLARKQDLTGSMAAVKLGAAYRKLGEDDKALEIFKRLAENALLDSVRARADIETAITLEGQGKADDAITALVIADSLGKAALGGEARYRIGLVYEQLLSDFPKAGAAYDEASKSTNTEYGKAAAKRSGALRAVARYEQALSDSTLQDPEKQAMNRFLLAETYLMDLGMAARAETQLRLVSDSLSVNTFTARSKLALGSLLEADGDSSAQAYYQAVIDSFPTTVYANMARSRLGLPLVDVPAPVAAVPVVPAADTTRAAPASQVSREKTEFEGPPLPGPDPEPGSIGPDVAPPDSLGLRSARGGGPRDAEPVPPDTTLVPQDTTGGRGTDAGAR